MARREGDGWRVYTRLASVWAANWQCYRRSAPIHLPSSSATSLSPSPLTRHPVQHLAMSVVDAGGLRCDEHDDELICRYRTYAHDRPAPILIICLAGTAQLSRTAHSSRLKPCTIYLSIVRWSSTGVRYLVHIPRRPHPSGLRGDLRLAVLNTAQTLTRWIEGMPRGDVLSMSSTTHGGRGHRHVITDTE